MARYIDAELAIELKSGELWAWDVPDLECFLADVPTADVVPKSEVVSIFDELMKQATAIADRYKKLADETLDRDYARIEYKATELGSLLVLFKIAELKKKYVEG